MKKSRTSLELLPGQSSKLEIIARRFGYLQTRGTGAGKAGSVSAMIQAIAKGELLVIKKENQNET